MQHLLHAERRLTAEEAGDGDGDDRYHDEAADLLRRPRVGDARRDDDPEQDAEEADERHQGQHRDLPHVVEDEAASALGSAMAPFTRP